MTSRDERTIDLIEHPPMQTQDQPQCRIVKLDDTAEIHLYPTVEAANLASSKRLRALLESGCISPCMPATALQPVQENRP